MHIRRMFASKWMALLGVARCRIAAARRLALSGAMGVALLAASVAPGQPLREAGAGAPEAAEAGLGLDRTARRQVQLGLVAGGFDAGVADGQFGRQTRRAIRRWQASRGIPATGYLDGWSAALLRGAREEAVEAALELNPAARRQVQRELATAGFDVGGVDGQFGRQTRRAIRRWQASRGIPTTGYLDGWSAALLREIPETAVEVAGRAAAAAVPHVPAGEADGPAAGTCVGRPAGAACWTPVAGKPGCHVWNPYLQAGESVTWSGECSGGVAQGMGMLTRISDRDQQTRSTGRLQGGRQTGNWVTRLPSGNVLEGRYVDGRRSARWVFRVADGTVIEFRYADGEMMESKFVRRAAPPARPARD